MSAYSHFWKSDEYEDINNEKFIENWSGLKQEFFKSVHNQNVWKMKKLLKIGLNPNSFDYYGRTALHLSLQFNNHEMIYLLCSHPHVKLNQKTKPYCYLHQLLDCKKCQLIDQKKSGKRQYIPLDFAGASARKYFLSLVEEKYKELGEGIPPMPDILAEDEIEE